MGAALRLRRAARVELFVECGRVSFRETGR